MTIGQAEGSALQRLYCTCGQLMDLDFKAFHGISHGITVDVTNLPTLVCPKCESKFLPDRSQGLVEWLAAEATEHGQPQANANRKRLTKRFNFGETEFQYEADDYYYIPGLVRPWDDGFLTPVFFNLEALLKYEHHPDYQVKYASATYGTIDVGSADISFGINRHGKVVMWLGDIAKLPKKEQLYLASENVSSDHSIGSDFYEGQIECVFTDPPPKDTLFRLRSEFLTKFAARFGQKIGHLDAEVLKLAGEINTPVVDTPRARRHIADTLNKVYVESFDNKTLGKLLEVRKIAVTGSGTLKRLEGVLSSEFAGHDISTMLSPLFTLYDFRVAALHLGSEAGTHERMESVTTRLGLSADASLFEIYETLIAELSNSFSRLGVLF